MKYMRSGNSGLKLPSVTLGPPCLFHQVKYNILDRCIEECSSARENSSFLDEKLKMIDEITL